MVGGEREGVGWFALRGRGEGGVRVVGFRGGGGGGRRGIGGEREGFGGLVWGEAGRGREW